MHALTRTHMLMPCTLALPSQQQQQQQQPPNRRSLPARSTSFNFGWSADGLPDGVHLSPPTPKPLKDSLRGSQQGSTRLSPLHGPSMGLGVLEETAAALQPSAKAQEPGACPQGSWEEVRGSANPPSLPSPFAHASTHDAKRCTGGLGHAAIRSNSGPSSSAARAEAEPQGKAGELWEERGGVDLALRCARGGEGGQRAPGPRCPAPSYLHQEPLEGQGLALGKGLGLGLG